MRKGRGHTVLHASVVPVVFTGFLGAILTPAPKDLELVSVEAVDASHQDELRAIANRLGGTLDATTSFPVFRVNFSTKTGLLEYARRYAYRDSTIPKISLCKDGKYAAEYDMATYSHSLFNGSGEIQFTDKSAVDEPSAGGVYEYHMYLRVAQAKPNPFAGTVDFDLSAMPQDICLVVNGHQMTGIGFTTNMVVIPGTFLKRALVASGI